MIPTCPSTTATGEPCRARPQPGKRHCRWHDPDPAAKAKHRAESAKGGTAKAYGALLTVEPVAPDLPAGLDLGTVDGGRQLLAVALWRLAQLPFDVRLATALGQLVTAQRAQIETADLERRLAALEKTTRPALRRVW